MCTMSTQDVIGDVAQLRQTLVNFNAVETVIGASVSGSFDLDDATGFSHLVAVRALARIQSDSLRCQVIGPSAPDKAIVAYVAVLPDTASDSNIPTEPADILTVGGSIFTQHSLYVGSQVTPVGFSQDVAHQVKPRPHVGSPPKIVYHIDVIGGDDTSVTFLRISGQLVVEGVGFVKSW